MLCCAITQEKRREHVRPQQQRQVLCVAWRLRMRVLCVDVAVRHTLLNNVDFTQPLRCVRVFAKHGLATPARWLLAPSPSANEKPSLVCCPPGLQLGVTM